MVINPTFICLRTSQSEMKLYGGLETMALKQHFGKKLLELEEEKRVVEVILDL